MQAPAASSGGRDAAGGGGGREARERGVEQQLSRAQLRAWLVEGGFSINVASLAAAEALSLRGALMVALAASTGPIALVHDGAAGPSAAAATEWEPEPRPVDSHTARAPAAPPSRDAAPTVRASNGWNAFQQRLAGTGLSRAEVARLYAEEQEALRVSTAAGPCGGAGPTTSPTTAADLPALSGAGPAPRASGPVPVAASEEPICQGYVVLRTLSSLQHLLGVHCCSWQELMDRFGLSRADFQRQRTSFYTPRITSLASAEQHWVDQGFALPLPRH